MTEPLPDKPLVKVLARLLEHLDGYYPERITLIQMRKFAIWFSAGFPGASAFRKTVFQCADRESTLGCINGFFESIAHLSQNDTSGEAFLMGGHG